jgi:pimeloyl-ACP methyl ester carboxylesterase
VIGRTLAHYPIVEKIGEGGMGEVYRARDTKLGREVALKILPERFAADSSRLARFQREARAVAKLNHPGIVTLFSLEEHEGTHFLTLELIEGVTLGVSLPGGGMPLEPLLDIGIPLADALAFAHKQGVVHRDLKLSNVIKDDTGRVRILDFGVSVLLMPAAEVLDKAATVDDLTSEGSILGTVAVMAPEQLRGRPPDSRMDLFAFGVLLYQLATGTTPFRGESTPAIVSSILRDDPPSLAEARPDLPPDLQRIVRRCLEKDPERRFQTAQDVRNELEDIRLYPSRVESVGQAEQAARGLVERRFKLTTNHLRGLSERIPRMIGDAMEYVDNEVKSDTLVVFLHGVGGDHRAFLPALSRMSYRGVAVTLFGFGPGAALRPALPLEDHHRLLRFFIEDLDRRLRPRLKLLVGRSSGGDQWLRLVGSPEGPGAELDGLLLLSPNIGLQSAFASRVFAELTDDPAHILTTFKSLGEGVNSLRIWLIMQEYLVQTSQKFGTNMAPLRRFGEDIVAPFLKNDDVFYEWARDALDRIPQVRFLFAEEEVTDAEAVIAKHLNENILGDRFTEETIQFASVRHMELSTPDVMLPHLTELVERLQGTRGNSRAQARRW